MPLRSGRKSLHTPGYSNILALLRRMREDAGLSQEALAKRLKRPRTYVTKSELGERRVDLLEWLKFCRACKSDPVAFLEKLNQKTGKKPQLRLIDHHHSTQTPAQTAP